MSNRFKFAASLGLIVAVFGLTGFLKWDLLQEYIVVPVYYLFWISGYIIESIPQAVYLVFLVAACAVFGLAARSHLRHARSVFKPEFVPSGLESRYRFWSRRLSRIGASSFLGDDFAFEIRRFLISILAYQERLEWNEVEDRIKNRELVVPEAVAQIIIERNLFPSSTCGHHWKAEYSRFLNRIGRKDQEINDQTRAQVSTILSYIEERLEIINDEPSEPASK